MTDRAQDAPAPTTSKKAQKAPKQAAATAPADNKRSTGSDNGSSDEDDSDSDGESPLELNVDNFGRPHGVSGKLDYSFRSIHNALRIPSDQSYLDLVVDCETAFTAREIEGGEYSTGTTFFLPATATPRCLLERMARAVFDFHTRDVTEYDRTKSGAEWWTLALDAGETNDDVSFHWDRDYGLEGEYHVNLHPHIATVTYLSTVGGPTVVLDKVSPVQTGGDDCGAGEIDKGYVSCPAMGKHISFDGRLLHGAPGDLATAFAPQASEDGGDEKEGAVGNKRKRSAAMNQRTRRITFLVNVWLNHVPMESEPLPDKDVAKFVSTEKAAATGVRFEFDEAEANQSVEEMVRVVSVDDALAAGKEEDAVPTLALSFVEAGREMTLMLPVPVAELQEQVRKTPQVSSFELQLPTKEQHRARLIAGEEVENEGDSDEDDDDEEDEDEDNEDEDEDEDDEEEE